MRITQLLPEWVKAPTFWHGVTSNVIANLVAALIIYVFALLAGYLGRPEIRGIIFGVVIFVAACISNIWLWRNHRLVR